MSVVTTCKNILNFIGSHCIGDETAFACTGYSASHRQNYQKSVLQNGMLHFVF